MKPLPKCDAIVFTKSTTTTTTQQSPILKLHITSPSKRLTPNGNHNNNNNKSNNSNGELQQHTIQCQKLAELSIQKAKRYTHQQKFANYNNNGNNNNNAQFSAWTPHDALPPRETLKLRSAEERRRHNIHPHHYPAASSMNKLVAGNKRVGYSQIIKRVLEHYDPSKNQVRKRLSPSTSAQQLSGLTAKGLVSTT